MKKMFFILWSTCMLATSCMQAPEFIDSTVFSRQTTVSSHYLSLDDAIKNFIPIYEQINATRSSILPEIASVDTIRTKLNTRGNSGKEMASYYLVNFEDNMGFAILAADDRINPVLAFSTESSLNPEAPDLPHPIKNYINGIVMPIDTTIVKPNPRPDNPQPEVFQIGPMVPQSVSQWNQKDPYDKYCNGWPTGCGPLAVSMICASFKYPKYLDSKEIKWDYMINNPKCDEIAWFIWRIGQSNYLNSIHKYYNNQKQTETNSNYYIPTFSKLGFIDSHCSNLSAIGARTHLNQQIPLLITGSRINDKGEIEEIGHSWVMDGYMQTKYSLPIIIGDDGNLTDSEYYYHCVWGYGDRQGNGYFSNIRALGGKPDYLDILDHAGNIYPEVYTEKLKMYVPGLPSNE